jgi:hypothetical protein
MTVGTQESNRVVELGGKDVKVGIALLLKEYDADAVAKILEAEGYQPEWVGRQQMEVSTVQFRNLHREMQQETERNAAVLAKAEWYVTAYPSNITGNTLTDDAKAELYNTLMARNEYRIPRPCRLTVVMR